jgi:hypothetical protein
MISPHHPLIPFTQPISFSNRRSLNFRILRSLSLFANSHCSHFTPIPHFTHVHDVNQSSYWSASLRKTSQGWSQPFWWINVPPPIIIITECQIRNHSAAERTRHHHATHSKMRCQLNLLSHVPTVKRDDTLILLFWTKIQAENSKWRKLSDIDFPGLRSLCPC